MNTALLGYPVPIPTLLPVPAPVPVPAGGYNVGGYREGRGIYNFNGSLNDSLLAIRWNIYFLFDYMVPFSDNKSYI